MYITAPLVQPAPFPKPKNKTEQAVQLLLSCFTLAVGNNLII